VSGPADGNERTGEDLVNHPEVGDERDDAHRPATSGTDQWIDLVDAAEKLGPPATKGTHVGVARGLNPPARRRARRECLRPPVGAAH
jgi:hypothetical protein